MIELGHKPGGTTMTTVGPTNEGFAIPEPPKDPQAKANALSRVFTKAVQQEEPRPQPLGKTRAKKAKENLPPQAVPWKRAQVTGKTSPAKGSPTLSTRYRGSQAKVLRKNFERYFKDALNKTSLDEKDLKKIDTLVGRLIKIDTSIESKLPRVTASKAAPFTVHHVEKIEFGGKTHTLELGQDFKVLAHAVNAKAVGKGTYGAVSRVGTLVKEDIPIMRKLGTWPQKAIPQDLTKEKKYTNQLHESAGGHQRGVQRAPYRIFSVTDTRSETRYGYFVPGYITDMLDRKILTLSTAEQTALGLTTPMGLARGALDLLIGLEAAHKAGIAHRDIKPQNIGIQKSQLEKTQPEWALADWGLATTKDNEVPLATPNYITDRHLAIQELTTGARRKTYQKQQDMFALAVSLLEIYYTAFYGEENFGKEMPSWRKDLLKYVTLDEKWQADPTMPNHPADCESVKEFLEVIETCLGPDCKTILRDMLAPPSPTGITAQNARSRWEKAISRMDAIANDAIYPDLDPDKVIKQLIKLSPGAVLIRGDCIYVRTKDYYDLYDFRFIKNADETYALATTEEPPQILLDGLKTRAIPAPFLEEFGKRMLTVDKRLQALEEKLPDALIDRSTYRNDHVDILREPLVPTGAFIVWKPYNVGLGPSFMITVKREDGSLANYSISVSNNLDKVGFFVQPLDTEEDTRLIEATDLDNLLTSLGLDTSKNYSPSL